MRAALVTGFDWRYRYGFNAILNGLDYHGNVVDVHALHTDGVPPGYMEDAQKLFPFQVCFYDLDRYAETKGEDFTDKGDKWALCFYRYKLAEELASEYDALMIVDCSFMIVSDIDVYFRAVAGKDVIMAPNNFRSSIWSHINGGSSCAWKEWLASGNSLPIDATLLLCSPRNNLQLFSQIYLLGSTGNDVATSLNKALAELRLIEKTLVLSHTFWTMPALDEARVMLRVNNLQRDRRTYFMAAERLLMVYGCWWSRKLAQLDLGVLRGRDEDMIERNIQLLLAESKEINTEWKLPLEWIEEKC